MKTATILAGLLFTFQAFGGEYKVPYQCEDGGLLEIGLTNLEGYAEASLTYEGNRSSSLDAIWFTSDPNSSAGTMLSDEGEELGSLTISEDGTTVELDQNGVKCTRVDEGMPTSGPGRE